MNAQKGANIVFQNLVSSNFFKQASEFDNYGVQHFFLLLFLVLMCTVLLLDLLALLLLLLFESPSRTLYNPLSYPLQCPAAPFQLHTAYSSYPLQESNHTTARQQEHLSNT